MDTGGLSAVALGSCRVPPTAVEGRTPKSLSFPSGKRNPRERKGDLLAPSVPVYNGHQGIRTPNLLHAMQARYRCARCPNYDSRITLGLFISHSFLFSFFWGEALFFLFRRRERKGIIEKKAKSEKY